jgi:hypothetical protein
VLPVDTRVTRIREITGAVAAHGVDRFLSERFIYIRRLKLQVCNGDGKAAGKPPSYCAMAARSSTSTQ